MTAQRPDTMENRNLRLIAERTGWPSGAIDLCLLMEAAFPEWTVWWARRKTAPGFECPAGFHASYRGRRRSERRELFDETGWGLREQLEQLRD
jgi:hypothetical protein